MDYYDTSWNFTADMPEGSYISPAEELATRWMETLYGKALLSLLVAIYTGIIIAGTILDATNTTVNTEGSFLVWGSFFAVALLVAREFVPTVGFWFRFILHRPETSIEPPAIEMPMANMPTVVSVKPRDRKGYVYLVQSPTGAYKIGRTNDPDDRLRTFNVKLPFEVEYACVIETPDMYALERELHRKFAGQRINGEWFNLLPADVEYIKSLA